MRWIGCVRRASTSWRVFTPALALLMTLIAAPAVAQGTPALVQHTGKDAGTTTSSTLAFTSANTAGNFIAVVIRAGNSGQTFTVTDSRGNGYLKAAQLNETVDNTSLAIYYAENIAAGANTVTVSDSLANGTLRFAIMEYSGVAPANALDATAAAQGTSTAPNSGPAVTTANGDLVLGAISTANGRNYTPGAGFVIQDRVPSNGNGQTKLATEDQPQAAAGSIAAAVTLNVADTWGAIVATFRAAAGGPPPAPNIAGLNPSTAAIGTLITISGTNFGATQGGSTVTFNGTTGSPTGWSSTSIVVPVPAGATSGNVVVTVGGTPSNGSPFTVSASAPSLTSLNPTTGAAGTAVTITGTNFGATQGASVVRFNGTTATPTSWSATSIVVPVPAGATSGNVVVTVGGLPSNGLPFTVPPPPPSLTSLNPTSGAVGTPVTIAGTNFGATQGTSVVRFNGTTATPTSWSATSIAAPVPAAATSGNVVVTVGGANSNGLAFTVTQPAPSITSLNPTSGVIGTSVTITGTNFGATQGASTVTFNGTPTTPTSWSATSLVVPVPTGASTGPVVVIVNGLSSNGAGFTVTPPASGITLVQHVGKDAGNTTSTTQAFAASNTAGNFIAVAIRAGGVNQVFTVTDTRGNLYRRAIQLNETVDTTSVALFYAENIASGPNTVTISDSIPNGTLRIAIMEYSGVASANSLDVALSAQGTSTTPSSGAVTTTSNGDLIVGVITSANPQTVTAGAGFTIQDRVPASPNSKLITEDARQSVAGPIAASGTFTSGDHWGALVVAFKASNAPPTLTITQPANGSTVFATTVNVQYVTGGNTTGAGVDHVHFTLDNNPEVMDLSLDGVYQFTNVSAGPHTLNGYLVLANHSKIQGTDAPTVSFTTSLPDTVPPQVSITSPADASTVSGLITVSADASDDVGVGGVQFSVDSTNIGPEDTLAQYAAFFDTTTLANGLHTFRAVARDLGNNTATATVTVNVSNTNPNDPSRIGQWSGPYSWPMIPLHQTMMPNGKVLAWDDHTSGNGAQVWDPIANTFTAVPYTAANLFCAAVTTLGDGRPILVGGEASGNYIGIPNATIFNYSGQSWSAGATMAYARWYPTATTLGDGRILALSGAINCPTCPQLGGSRAGIADIPEVYDPVSNAWSQLASARLILPLYPHIFTLPDGRAIATSTSRDAIQTTALDVNTQTWTPIGSTVVDGGSAVQYLPGKFLKTGTSRSPSYEAISSAPTAYVLDTTQSNPQWRRIGDMSFRRVYHNMTMLPDGNVLVTGGSRTSNVIDLNPAVLEAELWSPLTETWTTLDRMVTPRVYHSTGLLLPDGRVLVAAGGGNGAGIDQPNSEIYSPPYLFKGPRPTVTSAPAVVTPGATFFVATPDGAQIASVSMIRIGSVTHAFNMGQAFVPLAFQVVPNGLDVTAPANTNIAPPGEYMLFVVSTSGVPSIAKFMNVPPPGTDSVPPTAPTNLTAAVLPGGADLSWTASTDNVAVTRYLVERCQGSGCSIFGQIGTSTTTTYSDTGLAAASYTYRVRATDAAGNLSGYSNTFTITIAVPGPVISGLNPTSGLVGSSVTISGSNFGASQGISTVRFGGADATATSWSASSIVVTAPATSGTVTVVVTVGGVPSNGSSFTVTVPAPAISGLNPTSGAAGTPVTISGSNFGATQGGSSVTFNGTTAAVTSWSATAIGTSVPAGATTGLVRITVGGQQSNGMTFTVPPQPPSITAVNPTSGVVGTSVTITGTNFGASQGSSTVTFNGTSAVPTTWAATTIVVPVPSGATSGNVVVTVNGQPSNGFNFSIAPATGGIALIQHVGQDAGTTQSTSLAFPAANTGGNFIAVAIRAGQVNQVFTVTDTRGNLYRKAVQLNETVDTVSVAVYYAENIASGPNTITVSDSLAGGTLRIAILEYSGLATANALDVAGSGQGTSTALNSGSVTTTSNGDLVLGVLTTANGQTFTAGSGFTIRDRVPAAGSKLVTEDLKQTTAGPLAVTATIGTTDHWGAVIATFRAADVQPTMTITQPVAGSLILGTTINVTYSAGGNLGGVDHVHFTLDSNPEVMDLTFDGVYQFNNVPVGNHTLNGYLVRANHTKIPGTDATPVSFSGAFPDTPPPPATLTSPTGGIVSHLITVSADANDDVGVAGVRFYIDDVTPIGAEDTTFPYAVFFDTTTVPNGTHTFKAVARDIGGNLTATPLVTVTITNADPNDPSRIGQWSGAFSWPIVAIHTALMPNGKVLAWDSDTSGGGVRVWDPPTNTWITRDYTISNLFCAGLTTLADGRPFLIGGHITGYVGTRDAVAFDYTAQNWFTGTPMNYGRWYPTATLLPNGRVLALSGAINCPGCVTPSGSRAGIADVPEIYDPATNSWTSLTAQSAKLALPLYPHMFVLPDGRVLATSTQEDPIATTVLDVNAQTWTTVDPTVSDGGSAAMYLPGKIMKSGTGRNPDYSVEPSARTTYVIDMAGATPRWRQTPDMAFARTQHNLTMLPDGSVLATGGSRDSNVFDVNPAVLEAESWSPLTESWTTLARMHTPRLYHSTALLLPDGRVLTAGGGRYGVDQLSGEIYSPPYLFKGPRPTVTSAPALVGFGETFFVGTPDGGQIASVSMIKLGAVTHAINMGQVYVPLTFEAIAGGINVHAPANSNIATPGYYMLFLISADGVPSVARFVRLPIPAADSQPPTAPTGLTATAGTGFVDLSWTASTDNVAVAGYDVHRSTTAGFVPTQANRVGQAASTNYQDTGFSAGTYHYLVLAKDAAGNVSGPSNEVPITAILDTTPPTVSITVPAPNDTLAGQITVTATAGDDVGVAGVQFLLDGAALGAEKTSAPWTYGWNTATTNNGSHRISAVARDAAGNSTTAAEVQVTVANTQPSGLVAAYAFNENGGTTATDASGNGNAGAIQGATWTASGRFGSALQFDGVDSRVTVADSSSLDLTNGMTLEAWVYPTVALTGWMAVVDKDIDRYYLMASSDIDVPAIGGTFGTANVNVRGVAPLAVNTWTHLAATYDRTRIRLYVNGVEVASIAQTAAISTSAAVLTIGADFYGEYFTGLIDEVRIYDRALSAAEIQTDSARPIEQPAPPPDPPAAGQASAQLMGSQAQLRELKVQPRDQKEAPRQPQ